MNGQEKIASRLTTRQRQHQGNRLQPHAPLETSHQCQHICASPEEMQRQLSSPRTRASKTIAFASLLNNHLHVWCFVPCPNLWRHLSPSTNVVSTAEQWQSAMLAPGTSKSRTNAFFFTRPTTSLPMRADPRRLSTSARAHAARWWPKESRRRPHLHARPATGSC